ncbi:MAG: outer membrane protein assembly factor BamE [Parvularculaceae bacterium]|nr:outer membrane protein assembly factor BamE [Caulobacterales bacterium]
MKRYLIGVAAGLAAVVSLSGCVAVRSSHGYVLERGEEGLDAKVGLDTKESVLARYGEPSLIGTFDQNAWYYMTSFDTARAFFRPKTQRREIIAFQFDDEGVVKNVGFYDLSDGMDVSMVSRVTPTRGKELTFWEQLLGNVGQLPAAGVGEQQGPQ